MRKIKYKGTKEDYEDFLVGRLLRFADEKSNCDEALKFIGGRQAEKVYEDYIEILEEEIMCGCKIPSPE